MLNASWGSLTFSPALRDTIAAASTSNILVVAAAGNGDILGRGLNTDERPFYPASLDLDNIISVAASDQNDQLARFSNFGPTTIDVAAPGVGIWSTEPGDIYQERNGTSMATPHVTATVALAWAHLPQATPAQIKSAILSSVDVLPSLQNRVATGGRLNAYQALLFDPIPPESSLTSAADVTTAGSTIYQFTVTYTDNAAINVASLDNSDILVSKLGGFAFSSNATLINVDNAANGTPRVATYQIAVPGGSWDFADNGTYQINLRAGQVRDASGNAAVPKLLGSFNVTIPEPVSQDGAFRVNSFVDAIDVNLGDDIPADASGNTTLRAAIMQANAKTGDDKIILPAGEYILLIAGVDEDAAAQGDLDITGNLTIEGAGADRTFVNANDIDRVFHILGSTNVTISGLSIRNGTVAGAGGGVLNAGTLTLNDVIVSDNITSGASGTGGGIHNTGTLQLTNTTIDNNTAAQSGGGIHNADSADLDITRSSVSNNIASATGGGIHNATNATADVVDSTISDNQATGDGGGVLNLGTLTVTGSTLSGNASQEDGGGIKNEGTLVADNTTISSNSATNDGGGVANYGTATLSNVTIVENDGTAPILNWATPFPLQTNIDTPAWRMRAADLQSDGDLDIVIASEQKTTLTQIFNNAGFDTFGWTTFDTEQYVYDYVAANLNSDSNVDFAAITRTGSPSQTPHLTIVTGSSGAGFTKLSQVPLAGNPGRLDVIDIDNDGDLDLVVPEYSVNALTIYRNDGNAAFTQVSSLPVSTAPQIVIAADLNGDGFEDLASAGGNTTRIVNVLLNNGNGTFASAVSVSASATLTIPLQLLPVDLDGDGDLDLVSMATGDNSILLYDNDGSGGFATPRVLSFGGTSFHQVSSGDFDGDGHADLALIVAGGGVAIYLNNGDGTFRSAGTPGTIFNVGQGILAASLDRSGPSDIVAHGSDNQQGPNMFSLFKNQLTRFSRGHGIFNAESGTVTLKNSIIAGQSTAESSLDVFGQLNSLGNNLVSEGGGAGGFIGSDQVGTHVSPIDPKLAPLGDYGGPTKTHALLANSPAIDAGNNTGVTSTDQRGADRVLDGPDGNSTATVDIGAFEFGTFFVDTLRDDVDANIGDGLAATASGGATLRAALQESNSIAGHNVIVMPTGKNTLRLAGANEDQAVSGDLDVRDLVTIRGKTSSDSIIDGSGIDRVFEVISGGLNLEDVGVTGGANVDGAGIRVNTGPFTLLNSRVYNNGSALATSGGGLRLLSTTPFLIKDSVIETNAALNGHGGAVDILGPGRIENTIVRMNTGGGIKIGAPTNSTVEIVASRIEENSGGGVQVIEGNVVITDSTIRGNLAPTSNAGGLLLASGGTGNISRTTISDNQAGGAGGGVYVDNTTATFTNVTLSGNKTLNGGGGIFVNSGSAAIVSSTISQNDAAVAGGGFFTSRTVSIRDSIVAGNTSPLGPDLRKDPTSGSAVITSLGGNLIGDGTGSSFPTGGVGDQVGASGSRINPLLGPLQHNGGTTWTHALRTGSPAIDAGSNVGAPATDQRGITRPQDGNNDATTTVDIGAFEFVFGEPTRIEGRKFHDVNANGIQDANEPGLKDWTVYVDLNANGVKDGGEPATVTDVNGDYTFVGLAPGTYVIGEVAQDDWSQTWPTQLDFSTTTTLAVGDQPRTVAQGDLDGDGDLDLVTANFGTNSVSVILNKGDRTFAAATSVATGTGPIDAALFDVNGDGKLDILTANFSANSVSVLLNNGNGTFASAVGYSMGTAPRSVIAADVDGDGDRDLVSANSTSNNVSVRLNNGDGTFAATTNFAAGTSPFAVRSADFDRDGDNDLAVVNRTGFNVSILTNNGSGSFSNSASLTVGVFPEYLELGDIDGDVDVDIVTSNSNSSSVSVSKNNGSGTFAAQVQYTIGATPKGIELGDLDGDGDLDIVASRSPSGSNPDFVSLLLNDGTGTFAAATNQVTGNDTRDVALGDFDGDGHLDVAAVNNEDDAVTNLRNLTGSYKLTLLASDRFNELNFGNRLVPGEIRGTKFRDLNEDGVRDEGEPGLEGWTLFLDTNGNKRLDVGEKSTLTDANGHYVFGPLTPLTTYTVEEVQQIGWEQTMPDPMPLPSLFAASVNYASGDDARGVTAADFDGDGDLDIAVTHKVDDTVRIMFNQGDGTFVAGAIYPVQLDPHRITTADLDGDGDMDLAVANFTASTVSILRNNGDGTFGATVSYSVGEKPVTIIAADLDGDGDIDLATADMEGSLDPPSELDVSVLLNNGNGTFAARQRYAAGTRAIALVARDFDRDGDLDLAVANNESNNMTIMLNNGNGTFAAPVGYAADTNPWYIAAGDLNGDGKDDLAVSNINGGNVSVYFGNGDGTFASQVKYAVGINPRAVEIADFDRDGDLDLVTITQDFGTPDDGIDVLLNRGDGTFASPIKFATGDDPYSLLTADVDGDSFPDVVTANETSDGISVLINTREPTGYTVTLDIGSQITGLDFGNKPLPGEIRGRKFKDLDRDGVQDGNEPGLQDWQIFVDLNENGQFDGGEPRALTDVNGDYVLANLEALHTYVVDEVSQAGWVETLPEVRIDQWSTQDVESFSLPQGKLPATSTVMVTSILP